MIESVQLGSFGKKSGSAFRLGRVTAVVGGNESGKTTVFDALTFCACDFKTKASPNWKRLVARYGEGLSASAEGIDKPIPELDWFQFHALEARDADIPLAGADAKWLKAVKAKLLSGGVDYDRLLERLDDISTLSGTRVSGRRRKALQDRIAALEAEANALGSRLSSFAADEETAARAELRQKTASERLAHARKRAKEATEKLAGMERAREVAETRKAIALFARLEAANERAAEAETVLSGESAGVSGLEAAFRTASAARVAAEARREAADSRETGERETLRALEDEVAHARPASETAAHALGKLASLPPLREWKESKPSVAGIAAAIAAVLAGTAAAILIAAPFGFVALGASLLLAPALFFLLRTTTTLDNAKERAEAEAAIFGAWAAEAGWNGPRPSNVRETLERARAKTEALEAKLSDAKTRLRRAEDEARATRTETDGLLRAEREKAAEVDAWYRARGAVDARDYARRRETASRALAERDEIASRIDELMRRKGHSERGAFRERLLADLETFRAEDAIDVTDAEREAVRREAAAAEAEASRLAAEESDAAREAAGARARLETARGGVPEALAAKRRELAAARREDADQETLRKAALACAEIFREAQAENDDLIAGIRTEVAAIYSALTGGEREVEISNLDMQSVTAADSGGTLREGAHLSVGTRDAFTLALRLALAFRLRPSGSTFALDEPFRDYDPVRAATAAKALARFAEERDHQFIVFTKDEATNEALREACGADMVTIRL